MGCLAQSPELVLAVQQSVCMRPPECLPGPLRQHFLKMRPKNEQTPVARLHIVGTVAFNLKQRKLHAFSQVDAVHELGNSLQAVFQASAFEVQSKGLRPAVFVSEAGVREHKVMMKPHPVVLDRRLGGPWQRHGPSSSAVLGASSMNWQSFEASPAKKQKA